LPEKKDDGQRADVASVMTASRRNLLGQALLALSHRMTASRHSHHPAETNEAATSKANQKGLGLRTSCDRPGNAAAKPSSSAPLGLHRRPRKTDSNSSRGAGRVDRQTSIVRPSCRHKPSTKTRVSTFQASGWTCTTRVRPSPPSAVSTQGFRRVGRGITASGWPSTRTRYTRAFQE
jgi:hypothetical protein